MKIINIITLEHLQIPLWFFLLERSLKGIIIFHNRTKDEKMHENKIKTDGKH